MGGPKIDTRGVAAPSNGRAGRAVARRCDR